MTDPPVGLPPDAPLLLAYLHLSPDTPQATSDLLCEHIRAFADRERFHLAHLFIGVQGSTHLMTLRDLLLEIRRTRAQTVLITGPSATRLRALHRVAGVRVLTLADVARPRRR